MLANTSWINTYKPGAYEAFIGDIELSLIEYLDKLK